MLFICWEELEPGSAFSHISVLGQGYYLPLQRVANLSFLGLMICSSNEVQVWAANCSCWWGVGGVVVGVYTLLNGSTYGFKICQVHSKKKKEKRREKRKSPLSIKIGH